MMFLKVLYAFYLLFIIFPSLSLGKVVQILHTNDLHSFFDHYGHSSNRGGYGRLKTVIDEYKKWGEDQDVSTIYVDGGDFSEGHLFYNADNGKASFKMLDHLGVDISVLGNHDYLMGTDALEKILSEINLKTPLLGTNIIVDKEYHYINKNIVPFVTKKIDDIKIAFVGVTTNKMIYKWRLNNGKISGPKKAGKKWAKKLKKNHDFVFAINHLGLSGDKKFAKSARKYIDLVVGGHSHTALKKPVWVKGKKGKKIPIVQAGKHGKYLGRLILDLVPGRPLKVLKYELIPIKNIVKNETISGHIDEARKNLNQQYGEKWLHETISRSTLKTSGKSSKIIYQNFIVDALKESVGADIGINASAMAGGNYPIGPISRKDIMNSYPRMFDFEDIFGWKVYTTRIKGALIRPFIKWIMFLGLERKIYLTGIDFKYRWKGKKKAIIKKLRINGEKIRFTRFYTVALPEGLIKGGLGITKLTKVILRTIRPSKIPIWHALERKLLKEGGVGPDYLSQENLNLLLRNELKNRMFISHPKSKYEEDKS